MSHFANHVDAALETCDACRAFDKAPRAPIAGTTTASAFNDEGQVDLLFLDDLIVVRAMDVFSKYPLLHATQSKNPQAVWGAFRAGRLGAFWFSQVQSDGRGRGIGE